MFLELASVTPPPAPPPLLLRIYAATKWIHFSLQFHFLNPDYQPSSSRDNARPNEGETCTVKRCWKRQNRWNCKGAKIERLSSPRPPLSVLLPPRKKNRKKEIAPKTYPISVIRDSVADQRVISRCLFELPRDFVSFPWRRRGSCPLISRGCETLAGYSREKLS